MAMLRPWSTKTLFPSFLILYLLLCLLESSTDLRAAENQLEEPEKVPISITSEQMTFKNLEHKIIFEGKVFIHRGEIKMNADKAEVFLTQSDDSVSLKKKPEQGREVTKIIATGNVRIIRGLQKAKAEKGIYKRGEDVFILTGNPEVWDEDVHVTGKMITFFVQEERTLVAESRAVIRNGAQGLGQKN